MSAFTRMRRGLHLGFRSLQVVFRDKTLLLFPMIPITCTIAIVTSFYLIVGPDKVLFFLNTLRNERGVQLINWGYYENALVAYAILAIISVFFSFGLVACTRITLDERDSKFTDGLKGALRNIHWVIIWAFIAWTIGPILNLLDHQRHTSKWVRKMLKTSWSLLSYFVTPIVIVDRINLFSALRRSVKVMSKKWGNGAVSQLGMGWFFLTLSAPTIALFAYGHYREGPFPESLTFVVLAMAYMTIVVYQTASAVLSVVLYKYAESEVVVDGFNEKWLKEAFVKPKVYVLVEDDPNDEYEPVDEVPAPAGVVRVDLPATEEPTPAEPAGQEVSDASESEAPVETPEPAGEPDGEAAGTDATGNEQEKEK